jgi:hypothetical protein
VLNSPNCQLRNANGFHAMTRGWRRFAWPSCDCRRVSRFERDQIVHSEKQSACWTPNQSSLSPPRFCSYFFCRANKGAQDGRCVILVADGEA